MSESNALYRDTVKSRLLKFVIWAVVFTLVRLLLNNAIGMIIDKKSVIASTQTSIPKAGTVAAEFSSVPFLVVLGEVAAKWIYPVAMAAPLSLWGGSWQGGYRLLVTQLLRVYIIPLGYKTLKQDLTGLHTSYLSLLLALSLLLLYRLYTINQKPAIILLSLLSRALILKKA